MTASAEPINQQAVNLPEGFLKRALPALKKAINRHAHVPILANMLIKCTSNSLSVTVTDLETRVEYSETCIGSEFTTTIPFGEFVDAVKGAESVSLMVLDDKRVAVNTDIGHRELFSLPADEYPPEQTGDNIIAVITAEFADVVPRIALSSAYASDEQARGAVLMGTYLDGTHKHLRIISTDGYRMLLEETSIESGEKKFKAILPCTLPPVLNAIKPDKQHKYVTFGVYEKSGVGYVRFEYAGFNIVARLVDGQYPNYGQVLPKYDKKTPAFTLNRKKFLTVVENAAKAAGDRASMVTFGFEPGKVNTTAQSDVSGRFEATLPCETKNAMQVAFNGKYFAEVLRTFKCDDIRITLGSPLSPALITDPANDAVTAVLMPVRQ